MCLVSMESSTTRIEVGDMAVIGMVHNFHGSEVKAAVPMIKREDIVCLCIKEGDELTLSKLPERFIQAHHLVRNTARVTFREGARNPPRPDRVEFDNGEIVNFNSLPLKVELTCDARGDQPKPEQREVERRPVARRDYVGAVLAGIGRRPRTGVGVAVLTVLLMVGYTLL